MEDRVKPPQDLGTLVDKLRRAGTIKDAHEGFKQLQARIHRSDPEFLKSQYVVDWSELEDMQAAQLADAVKYGIGGQTQKVVQDEPRSLTKFSDAEMVMDMIRRGYAVMKLPADGGPPEVLRGPADSK